jgi:hypothetical protein
VDGRCSFESIIRKYDLMGDPALVELAKVVHGVPWTNAKPEPQGKDQSLPKTETTN